MFALVERGSKPVSGIVWPLGPDFRYWNDGDLVSQDVVWNLG